MLVNIARATRAMYRLACRAVKRPVELASDGAAWKPEEANGFVRIIPTGPDIKGLDVAATVIGNHGKAASSAKLLTAVTGRLLSCSLAIASA